VPCLQVITYLLSGQELHQDEKAQNNALLAIQDNAAKMKNAGPFVMTVGYTMRVYPEIAANLSSGGFSNYFLRPSYQDNAVTSYLEHFGGQYASLFK
jgi:hypothetical protein